MTYKNNPTGAFAVVGAFVIFSAIAVLFLPFE